MSTLKVRERVINSENDQRLIAIINKGLEKNEKELGKRYCPCVIEHTDDTVCMCKSFRDQQEPGFCHCGKFEKYLEG